MPRIFMFPGQSSKDPGMFERLVALRPENRARIDEASRIVGRDLFSHYTRDNDGAFATNRDVQVGVFLANHLFMESLEAQGVTAELSLGLSLGEYNHLVHIGALDFDAALRLVEARGVAYDQGPDGMMASVFPIALEELEEVVARAREHGEIEIANLNSPQQHVIAGQREAVNAARMILDEEFAIDAVVIEQKIPMHSSRFRPASELLRPALEAAPWQPPKKAYIPNVLGAPLPDPTRDQIVDLLTRHVFQSVKWRASIDLLADQHPGATFVEVGPRAVLHNLLAPRWRRVERAKTDSADDIVTAFAATVAKLRDAA